MNFAPVADVNINPKNPVINTRSFGESPFNVANKVVAYSKGLEDGGVLSVSKHFPGAKVQGGDYLGKLLDFIASAFIYLCGLYGRRLVFCGQLVSDPGILRSFSALYTSQPAASGKSVSA